MLVDPTLDNDQDSSVSTPLAADNEKVSGLEVRVDDVVGVDQLHRLQHLLPVISKQSNSKSFDLKDY